MTLPANMACTRPLVSGSGMIWPFNSTVAASSAMRTGWVRKPSWRCTGFGTNRLPSANRCSAQSPRVPPCRRGGGRLLLGVLAVIFVAVSQVLPP
jgi:hypothetical protein